jgi:O-glycosyl hydrolase
MIGGRGRFGSAPGFRTTQSRIRTASWLLTLVALGSGFGCAPGPDARIDIPGYPSCAPGTGGDLTANGRADLTVTIDVGHTRQRMLGFGASDCWSVQYVGRWPIEKREAIADLLFETGLDDTRNPRGAGLSVWRFNIGAGSSRQAFISKPWRRTDTFFNEDYTGYDWSRLPGQRWFLHAAKERGVDRFIAFVNSPPVNMTGNGLTYCDAGSGSTNLGEGREDDFAGYLADVAAHFREVEAVEFDVLSPFNEPQWDWEAGTQEGCRYSAEDIKRVVDVLAELPGLGSTEIEIPESGSILDLGSGSNYLEAFFGTDSPTNLQGKVAPRISGHSYKTDLPETGLVEHRLKLRAALDRHPGLQYVMTEYCPLGAHGVGRDLGIDTALLVSRVIHFDVVVAGASSWQWWLAVSPYDYKDGLIFVDHRPDDGDYRESKLLWALGNYSRFVRPGMVRVEVDRSDGAAPGETVEGLMVSSFVDRDRGVVATVFVNWSNEPMLSNIAVKGLRIRRWIPYVTSASSDLGAFASIEAGQSVRIPARSIVTLVGNDPSGRSPRRALSHHEPAVASIMEG